MLGKRGQSVGDTDADPEKSMTSTMLMKTFLVIALIVILSAILFRAIKYSGLAG